METGSGPIEGKIFEIMTAVVVTVDMQDSVQRVEEILKGTTASESSA